MASWVDIGSKEEGETATRLQQRQQRQRQTTDNRHA